MTSIAAALRVDDRPGADDGDGFDFGVAGGFGFGFGVGVGVAFGFGCRFGLELDVRADLGVGVGVGVDADGERRRDDEAVEIASRRAPPGLVEEEDDADPRCTGAAAGRRPRRGLSAILLAVSLEDALHDAVPHDVLVA